MKPGGLDGPWLAAALGLAAFLALAPLAPAAMALAGGAAVLLTLVRPEYGLYLLVLAVPFGSLQTIPLGSFEVTGVEAMVFLTALAWALQAAIRRTTAIRLTWFFLPALIFVVALAVSAWNAAEISADLEGGVAGSLKEILKWAEFLLVYVLAASILSSRRQMVAVLWVLLGAGTLAAMFGWVQFLLRLGPEGYIVGGRFLRAYGTFGQPNPYAGYLGMILALVFGILVTWLAAGNRPRRWQWLMVGAAGAMLAAVVMSLSRGAWVGLAISFALMLAISHRRGVVLLLGVALLATSVEMAGALDLLPSQVSERLASMAGSFSIFDARDVEPTPENWAVVERMANWQAAWNMFMDYPLLGVGVGNFARLYSDYALPYWKFYPAIHAHNYYLTLLAETGIVGLAAYLALMGGAFARALWAWLGGDARRKGLPAEDDGVLRAPSLWFSMPGLQKGVALGVFGLLIYLSTHSLFDDLYVHGMTAQVALFLGMLSGVGVLTEERYLSNV